MVKNLIFCCRAHLFKLAVCFLKKQGLNYAYTTRLKFQKKKYFAEAFNSTAVSARNKHDQPQQSLGIKHN